MKPRGVFETCGLVAALFLTLSGCDKTSFASDPAVQQASGDAYAELVTRRDAALLARLPKEAQPGATPQILDALRSFVPEGQGGEGKLVGWQAYAGTAGDSQNAVILYSYPDGRGVVLTTQFQRTQKTAPWQLFSFNLMPATAEHSKAQTFGTLPPPPPKTAPSGS